MSSTLATIAITLLSLIIGAASFYFATRAAHANARAQEHAVDADAYNRATLIYESTIKSLQADVNRLHVEITDLQHDIVLLRETNAKLYQEIVKFQQNN